MLPVSVTDILKILDQVPGWKAVMGLPKRVKELEERIAALEGRPKAPAAEACPHCGAPMTVTASRPDPMFGTFGVQEQTLACSNAGCGNIEHRQFDPNKQG